MGRCGLFAVCVLVTTASCGLFLGESGGSNNPDSDAGEASGDAGDVGDAPGSDAATADACAGDLPSNPRFRLQLDEEPPALPNFEDEHTVVDTGGVATGTVEPCGDGWSFTAADHHIDIANPGITAASIRVVLTIPPDQTQATFAVFSMDASGNNEGDMGLFVHDDGNPILVFRIQSGAGSTPGAAFHVCTPALDESATYEVWITVGDSQEPLLRARRWDPVAEQWQAPSTLASSSESIFIFGESHTCDSGPTNAEFTDLSANGNALWIGESNSGTAQNTHYDALIGDFALYDRRLTPP